MTERTFGGRSTTAAELDKDSPTNFALPRYPCALDAPAPDGTLTVSPMQMLDLTGVSAAHHCLAMTWDVPYKVERAGKRSFDGVANQSLRLRACLSRREDANGVAGKVRQRVSWRVYTLRLDVGRCADRWLKFEPMMCLGTQGWSDVETDRTDGVRVAL